jgi:hypothetical protein
VCGGEEVAQIMYTHVNNCKNNKIKGEKKKNKIKINYRKRKRKKKVTVEGSLGKKKFVRLHLHRKKVGMVGCTYHPSNGGKHKIELRSRAGLGKKQDLISKNNHSKNGWRYGSRGRAPA